MKRESRLRGSGSGRVWFFLYLFLFLCNLSAFAAAPAIYVPRAIKELDDARGVTLAVKFTPIWDGLKFTPRAIVEGDIANLVTDLASKEPALGNPGTSGYVLSSTTGGVRSWIAASGGTVTSVTGTAPIVSSGGTTPAISITAATSGAAGSMSSADKTKLDAISGTNTGDQDLSGYVPTSRTVNGHALSSNVTVTPTDLSLVIGTNVQAYDADLTTWAGITPGTGVGTFLATPSSANFASALTDETGSGAAVFANTPTLVTPALGVATATSVTYSGGGSVGGSSGAITLIAGGTNQSITFVPSGTGVMEERNGTSAQAFNLYNTYTDASNYERLEFKWSSNIAIIQPNKAGSGTARTLQISGLTNAVNIDGDLGTNFRTGGGTVRWKIDGSGHFVAGTDNTYDIGASGATRPRNLYMGTSVITPNLTISGNQSAAAWTTSGLCIVGVAGTLTDTTSSGTVAAAYTNKLGGNTIAASSATTFTNYISSYFSDPVAGTNVTLTNKYALGADSLIIGTSTPLSITTAGALTVSGGTITGGASGLTLNAGGTNQAVTINSSGTGVTTFQSAGVTKATFDPSAGQANFGLGVNVYYQNDIYTTSAGSLAGTVSKRAMSFIAGGANPAIDLCGNVPIKWSSNTAGTADAQLSIDAGITRNAAATIEVNNGTAGTLGTLAAATVTGGSSGLAINAGGTNQNITLTPSGTGKVVLGTLGSNLTFTADNTYDIGASGATRPRNLYIAGVVNANSATFSGGVTITSGSNYVTVPAGGQYYFSGRSTILSPADGNLLLQDNANTSFNRLQFGGTTSSFPALKRSSATLQARLADDSAYADFSASNITASGTVTTSAGTVATLTGTESLTNKKLGSLTTNGYVKTSSGDGTLSVNTPSQALDDISLGSSAFIAPRVFVKNLTVLTAGAPADLGSITLPAWVTRWYTNNSNAFNTIVIAETAAGTLAGATFQVRDTPGGGGTLITSNTGPASAGVATFAAAGVAGVFTSSTLYVRQNANSGNAGTISVYVMVSPIP